MHHLLFILKTFKLLRQHQPWKLLLIFALTLLNGITAGFSIVLLIPLLQLLNIGDAEATGGPALLIRDLAAKAGLPLTLETILLTYVALLSLTALLQYRKALLDTFIANYAYSFSGGEQQRLALARVLLRKPQLLLLDEATSSLDPENEKQIMEVLSLLREKVTIILVSHRESVLPWCDKVISL